MPVVLRISSVTLMILVCLVKAGALELREPTSRLTQDPLEEATKASQEAVALFNSGKYSQAVSPAKRAFELRRKALPKDDKLVRTAGANLAEIYFVMGKYADAEPLFIDVIKSYERISPDDSARVRFLGRLALVEFRLGNSSRTEELYRDGINLLERLYGPRDERLGGAIFALAEFYQFVGRFRDAEPLYVRLRDLREQTNSTFPPQLPEVLDRYACMLRKAGRRLEAIDLEVKAGASPFYRGGITTEQDLAIEGNIINGKALSLPKPSYPAQAQAVRAAGTVVVRVMIDEKGSVIRACAITGPPSLMQVSESAAFQSKFTATKVNNTSVKVQGIITYNFVHQ